MEDYFFNVQNAPQKLRTNLWPWRILNKYYFLNNSLIQLYYKIRLRLCIIDADPSSKFWHKLYHIMSDSVHIYYEIVSKTHYNDVILGAIASKITSLTIVYSVVYSDADKKNTSKLRVTGLCAGNSPGTREFPAQMASYAEMSPFDDVIIIKDF